MMGAEIKFQSLIPTLTVTDLNTASIFYKSLGFEQDWIWPDNNPTHASFSRDGVNFMVNKIDEDGVIQKGDIYFKIEGVETLHTEMTTRNLKVSDLIKSDYGMLDFSITDPWGHHIVFGTPQGEF